MANALAISASGDGVSEPELTYEETGENDGATGISRHTGSGEPLHEPGTISGGGGGPAGAVGGGLAAAAARRCRRHS